MSERTVSDAIVERMTAWGVDTVFGYSGDGINGVMLALRRAEPAIRFVQGRHEENTALMAVGYAKYGGRVGVVTSTQGPGAVHLLNGLYDARLDHVPVVAVVGQQKSTVLGSEYMQEIDLQRLFADVAAEFVQTVMSPEQVPLVIDRAFRTALATRSPAVVIVPHDVQQQPASEPQQEHGIITTAAQWRPPRVVPHQDDLQQAAALLGGCERPVVFVGQGARHAREEVQAVAEALGAAVVTSLLGKPYVDERLPYVAGTMGHLGTTASGRVLERCDGLLIVGSNDPWTEFYPPPGAARAVQIDLDGRSIGNRYPIEVGLVGDAALTLGALVPLLGERDRRPWQDEVRAAVDDWHDIRERRAHTDADPVNPERVVWELDRQLPADAQLAVDVGSCTYWYARQLRLPASVPAHVSGTLASMGCGVPYGIAAKVLDPGRPVIVLIGDGAMQMTGIAELVTIARAWPQWEDPRFVICVFDNRDLAEVSWEQREMEGEPRYATTQALPEVDYAAVAAALGLAGRRVDTPDDLEDAWREALAADRPFVLDVVTDASIPLLPPFPAGESKLEGMRAALLQEGDAGAHAVRLLDEYASHEQRTR
ncbi:MAG TPA: thiamine pyrophosphate-requiring protein [Rhodoglobus sp.]|nr:thiamine pyrophosphate-requiring protein [Rhodoglobus sp.]